MFACRYLETETVRAAPCFMKWTELAPVRWS
jgi:hypothetical protein